MQRVSFLQQSHRVLRVRVRVVIVNLGHGPVEERIVVIDDTPTVRDVIDALRLPTSTVHVKSCDGRDLPLATLLGDNACIELVLLESPG